MSGRTFHSDSRTWSNFQPDELVKLCGVHKGRWPVYVIKELMDNSAAALEEHGIANGWIRVELSDDYLRVSDSGPGVSDRVLDHVLDFDQFGGSNRHHKLPTRGAQGNAIMTIIGIVSAWSKESVEVHRPSAPAVALNVNLDPVHQSVEVDREEVDGPGHSCFVIPMPELPWKRGGCDGDEMLSVAKVFAYMNPHIAFIIRDSRSGTRYSHHRLIQCIGAEAGSGPVIPGNPLCGAAQWFTDEEFAERLAADVRARPDTTVEKWAKEFAYVGRFTMAGGERPISDYAGKGPVFLKAQSVRLRTMLMQSSDTRRPDDPRFEPLGMDRMAQFLRWSGADPDIDPQYHTVKGTTEAGVPFVCEVCLVQMPAKVNRAPAPVLAMNRTMLYGSPSFKALKWRDKVRGQWFETRGDLSTLCTAYEVDRGRTPAAILVHCISPSPGYSGYGKQNFDTSWLWEGLSDCMEKVTLECRRQRYNESRRTTVRSGPKSTIKEDLFDIFPPVLDRVTEGDKIPVLVRQLYYAVRPVYFRLRPDKSELHYGTFCAYLDQFEQNVAQKLVCLRDPRGTMYEPHSGKTVRLGTADVADFKPKKWEGHTIIFVEKENLASLMRRLKIHKRWDAIIVGSKGFAVEAIRDVLQKYKQLLGGMVKIVCLHDADPAGYMIGYDLATNLPRFGTNIDVQVIDVGLSVREAQENDWPDEPFKMAKSQWSMVKNMNRKRIPNPYDDGDRPLFEPEAWDLFMPSRFRGSEYPYSGTPTGRRVELNAIGNGSPRAFCEWVEMHLEAHGCKKVRPPDEIVDAKLKSARENLVKNEVGSYLMRMLGDDVVLAIMKEVGVPSYDLDTVLEGRPEQHWAYLCERAGQTGVDLEPILDRVMKERLPGAFTEAK